MLSSFNGFLSTFTQPPEADGLCGVRYKLSEGQEQGEEDKQDTEEASGQRSGRSEV